MCRRCSKIKPKGVVPDSKGPMKCAFWSHELATACGDKKSKCAHEPFQEYPRANLGWCKTALGGSNGHSCGVLTPHAGRRITGRIGAEIGNGQLPEDKTLVP